MAIDCDVVTAGIQSQCQYAVGETFSVQVEGSKLPLTLGVQTKLRWRERELVYLPASGGGDEFLWPRCGIPARKVQQPGNHVNDPVGYASVLLGCTIAISAPPGDANGALVRIELRCRGEGSSPVGLVPDPGDTQRGSHLLSAATGEVQVALASAVIGCGTAPAGKPDRWEPGMSNESLGVVTSWPFAAGGGMAVDCDAAAPGVQRTCKYAGGEAFRVQVHVTSLARGPTTSSGLRAELPYYGFHLSMNWNDTVTYEAMADPAAEVIEPACAPVDRRQAAAGIVPATQYNWTCYADPGVAGTRLGPIAEVTLRCPTSGQKATIGGSILAGQPGYRSTGTGSFIDAHGFGHPAELVGASVICETGDSGGDPPPTGTPPAPAEPTPTPPIWQTYRSPLPLLPAEMSKADFRLGGGRAGGTMAVDCDVVTVGVQSRCQYGVGESFPVEVHFPEPPAGGYIGFQLKLHWSDELMQYLPSADPFTEFEWPGCGIAARADNQVDATMLYEPSVLLGCSAGLELPISTYAGPAVRVQLRCDAAGSSPVALVSAFLEQQFGTHWLDPVQNVVLGTFEGAVVGCGVSPEGDAPHWDPGLSVDTTRPAPLSPPATPVSDGEQDGKATDGDVHQNAGSSADVEQTQVPIEGPPPPESLTPPVGPGMNYYGLDGAMMLDCRASQPGVQSRCQYNVGQTFTVQVHATDAPDDGYEAFQTKVRWNDASVDYLESADPRSEPLWPTCTIVASANNSTTSHQQGGGRLLEPSVLNGCLAEHGLPPSTYTGALMQLQLRCGAEGSSALELVSPLIDDQQGSHFLHGVQPLVPDLTSAVIGCGVPPEGEPGFWDNSKMPPSGPPPPPPNDNNEPPGTPGLGPRPLDGAMALDCDASAVGLQAGCRYDIGESFRVQVHYTEPAADGYSGFQTKVRWDDPLIEYLPAFDSRGELLWPSCTISARANNQANSAGTLEPSVLIGCVVGSGLAPSTYTGPIVELELRCDANGVSPIELVSPERDAQHGTHALDQSSSPLVPALTSAVVRCGPSSAVAGKTNADGAPNAAGNLEATSGLPSALPAAGKGRSGSTGVVLPLLAANALALAIATLAVRQRSVS